MIHLIENYYVDVDENMNYTLKRDTQRLDKENNKIYDTIGYYPSLKHSISACLGRLKIDKLKDKDMSLKMAILEIDKSTKSFIDKLNEVLPNIKISEVKK